MEVPRGLDRGDVLAREGPKLLRRGDYFYLIGAVGGTSGPPTGHMVVVSRSRSIDGPWEQCPHNPIVRTTDARERWWSRGHATLVEGPDGEWWMVYHGYENGYYTLGRQTLLEPIEWTKDGWFRARGGDLSQPIAKPAGGRPGPPASRSRTTSRRTGSGCSGASMVRARTRCGGCATSRRPSSCRARGRGPRTLPRSASMPATRRTRSPSSSSRGPAPRAACCSSTTSAASSGLASTDGRS